MPGADVMAAQLAAWEKIAEDWLWRMDANVARCDCGKGIALVYDDNGRAFQYTDEQWLALVVLHLRNHHPDLEPDV